MNADVRAGLAVLLLVTVGRLLLGATHDPLADEAYYAVWAQRPALGYYDQPPLLAWVLAAVAPLGHTPLVLRLVPILLSAVAPLALLRHAGDRALWLVWWAGLPPLVWLGFFATPDALLLPLWALVLAAALRGGRGWVLAGVFAGLAFLAKHSGLAVLPLLIAAADPAERRSPWPWVGLAILVGLAAPNVAWNLAHGGGAFGFQLREGLLHPDPPGLLGPPMVIGQQLAVVTPIAALAGIAWLLRRPSGRTDRMAWASAAPLLLFFVVAALGGPPEAHWPAPAWIGVGLGLSRARGRLLRAARLGAATALLLSVAVGLHSLRPLVPLATDPADRLAEGRLLADRVEAWMLPEGAASREGAAVGPILAERYQEAALLTWHTGLAARTVPGCGRASQYDLWDDPLPDEAWMVRPARGGPLSCVLPAWEVVDGPHPLHGVDARGRAVGRWQLFRVRRAGELER